MKADVLGKDGKKAGTIELPEQFSEELRKDVISRAILAIDSHERQPYGADPWAGTRTSASYRGRRKSFGTWANRGMHRTARIRVGTGYQTGTVRLVPHAVKGRKAHPPKAEKDWNQKINDKERRLAIRSAISATVNPAIVASRHAHAAGLNLPLVVEDSIRDIKRSKEAVAFLNAIGLAGELQRTEKRSIRAGRGKMRGRKYKTKKGPLVVIDDDKKLRSFSNIPGVDVVSVSNLNAKLLAPGALPGRLTVWTKGAVERMAKEKLFV